MHQESVSISEVEQEFINRVISDFEALVHFKGVEFVANRLKEETYFKLANWYDGA